MPIPPPPPGPPPPPTFNLGSASVDPNARNQLLDSIRQGKRLKKTVTNDKSGPLIDGNRNKASGSVGGGSNSLSIHPGSGGTVSRGNGLAAPQGLGDLFAGGIPKLKPVGSTPVKGTGSGFNRKINASPSHTSSISSHSTPNHHYSSKTNNNYQYSTTSSLTMKSNSTSLGNKAPPPPPPPSNLKPSRSSEPDESHERKPSTNFGKPSLAPKPPGANGQKPAKPDPPRKLSNLYIPPADYSASANTSTPTPPTPPSAGVNRAQSMRMPKPASPSTASASSIEYRTMGRAAGKDFASNSSQPPPPPRVMNGGAVRGGRPGARPPPPPNKIPPSHPPPPPPVGAAPPPPPHRTAPAPTPPHVRVNGNLGPLPPIPNYGSGAPPPPPTRNSSMRSITSTTSVASSSGSSTSSVVHNGPDLDARFGHLFVPLEKLPSPTPFKGILKTYPSKNVQSIKRQPAPQPPTHVQLDQQMWANNNTSTC